MHKIHFSSQITGYTLWKVSWRTVSVCCCFLVGKETLTSFITSENAIANEAKQWAISAASPKLTWPCQTVHELQKQ